MRYVFPGPGKTVYLLTLSVGCVACDAGSGITIERMERKKFIELHDGFVDGPLSFEKWADSEGVAIIAGHRKHEFVKALLPQLMGLEWRSFCDDGILDEAGAEVILEELYEHTRVMPHFPDKASAGL